MKVEGGDAIVAGRVWAALCSLTCGEGSARLVARRGQLPLLVEVIL